MARRTGPLLCLGLLLAACTGGGGAPTLRADGLSAEEVRDGCVAGTLDVLQLAADRLGAVAGGALDAPDCALLVDAGGGEFLLACPDAEVRGAPADFIARVVFLRDGLPLTDPAGADAVRLTVESRSDAYVTDARLDLRQDADRGLLVDGVVTTQSLDGCTLEGTLGNVTARPVADLPGGRTGVLFTSGNVDFDVRLPDRTFVTGTAALVGRSALVSLEVGGVFTQGAIMLGGE